MPEIKCGWAGCQWNITGKCQYDGEIALLDYHFSPFYPSSLFCDCYMQKLEEDIKK